MEDDGVSGFFGGFGLIAVIIGIFLICSESKKISSNKKKYSVKVIGTCVKHETAADNPDLDPEERKELEEEERLEAEILEEDIGKDEGGEIKITDGVVQAKSKDGNSYSPVTAVYSFVLDGKSYEARERYYVYPAPNIKVGDMRELRVNPENPKEIYDPKLHKTETIATVLGGLGALILGAIFILVGFLAD